MEIVDFSLADGNPEGLQVLAAMRTNFVIGQGCMARKSFSNNERKTEIAPIERLTLDQLALVETLGIGCHAVDHAGS
jgi:hypothetical protein